MKVLTLRLFPPKSSGVQRLTSIDEEYNYVGKWWRRPCLKKESWISRLLEENALRKDLHSWSENWTDQSPGTDIWEHPKCNISRGVQSGEKKFDNSSTSKARESNRVHSLSRSLKTRLGGISWNGLAWKDGKGSNTRTRLSVGTLTKAPRMLKLVSNWIEYISVKINVPKSVHYYVPQNSSEMNRASRNLWVRRCSVSPITVSYYWDAWWIYSSESLELSDDCTGYAEEQEPEGWKEITKQVLSFFKKTLP